MTKMIPWTKISDAAQIRALKTAIDRLRHAAAANDPPAVAMILRGWADIADSELQVGLETLRAQGFHFS